MKAIITGLNGTLAPYIYDCFAQYGYEIIPWNRNLISIDDPIAVDAFIKEHAPDLFLHVATGPSSWIEHILKSLAPLKIPFVFTSTESVYDLEQVGPFTVEDLPRARSDYGKYKIACENIINRDYSDHSYIIRLGWQIATHTHKNNMLAYLVTEEHISASSKWILSTSFMPDTAEAIYRIVSHHKPDIYHVDGNTESWSFYRLVTELKEAFKLSITYEESTEFPRNNRLLDERVTIKSIQDHIQEIKNKHEK